ncbi:MAG: insulinase family protein [candidate division Zixibacteria bacterium]|nr:insulinase family protein [candidate division Zixibacteria bacterium]
MARSLKIETRDGTYQKTTLKNGLRVVSETLPSVRSISIGVWVDVGSRKEGNAENGLSHFIEHMVFKGTHRRRAKQIAASLESLGGALNAFTTREHTCFTARVLDEHLVEAIDVLADIVCHSTMTPVNMNRERQVICEEIKESLDTPSDHIHDLFSQAYWGKHPLGQTILGPPEIINGVSRGHLRGFMNRHYRNESIVIAASGAVSHRKLVKLVQEHFEFGEGTADGLTPVHRDSFVPVSVTPNDSNQTHFCLGFPGLSYSDPRKMAMLSLTSYLGGGMSSVLFQKIREQRGLVYTVFSFHDCYVDSGIFGVYLGTDHTRVREACDVVLDECRRMKKKKLTASVLELAKAQIKGHLMLGLESTSNRQNRIGRLEMMTGDFVQIKEVIKAIDRVTPSDIAQLANECFNEAEMTIAVLGPVDKKVFDGVGRA